jgi:hypothetical protein
MNLNKLEYHKRPTYAELVRDTITNPKDKIALPDRYATQLRNTPQMTRYDDESFLDLTQDNKTIMVERMKQQTFRQQVAATKNKTHTMERETNTDPPDEPMPASTASGSGGPRPPPPDEPMPASSSSGPPPPRPPPPANAHKMAGGVNAQGSMHGRSQDEATLPNHSTHPPPPPPPPAAAAAVPSGPIRPTLEPHINPHLETQYNFHKSLIEHVTVTAAQTRQAFMTTLSGHMGNTFNVIQHHMTAAAGPAAAAKPPETQPMDESTGGYGKHNPKGPPGAPGIRISDGRGMYRKPRADQYAKSKPSAPPPGPSYSSIIGPAPGGPPPKGPAPSAGPSAPPPAIAVSGTKNPAQPGVVAKVKRAKTRMVEEPIHHPIRPKPIAVARRPPRSLAVVPTEKEAPQAKRYKKAEEEVLGVAPDAEAKPIKPSGRGSKKEQSGSKGFGTKVKKEQLKSPATVFKRVNAKKSVDVTLNEPDKEVAPKASKGKSSKPKPIVKGKGYGVKVQKQQVKEPTTVFRRRRIRVKTPPGEVAAASSSSTPPPPPPAPAPRVKVGKGKGGGAAARKPTEAFDKTYATPAKKSKNYVELEALLRSLNTRKKDEGLSPEQVEGFRTLMAMIKKSGPDAVNKAIVKRALDTYNKSNLGIKANAKTAKA